MQVTPGALQAINVGFEGRFRNVYDATVPQAMQLATPVPSSTKSNTYGWMTRIPKLREWIGDRVVQNLEAQSYAIENKSYELTVGVDRDDIQDDQLGVYNGYVDEMGRQAKLWPDDLIVNVINAAETTLCFDGQYFFDTDHPTKIEGGATITQTNLYTTRPLTANNYFYVRGQMRSYKGEDGRKLQVNPNLLVVPPALEKEAREILIATRGANGADNVAQGTADLLVLDELTSDTDWYLMDTKRAVKPFVFQLRQSPQMAMLTEPTTENVFKRKEFLYGVDARGNAGYALWFLAAKAKA